MRYRLYRVEPIYTYCSGLGGSVAARRDGDLRRGAATRADGGSSGGGGGVVGLIKAIYKS